MADKSWRSFVAGAVAGGVEGAVTYPFEFAKTRLQLAQRTGAGPSTRNPLKLIYSVARKDGLGGIYAGCVPFVIGNTAKAGVRFLGFDFMRESLRDKDGYLSPARGALAGLGAGVLESVIALTPGESLKTALIDDRQSGNPKYSGNGWRGIRNLVNDKGIGVLYRGVLPVTARQAANQTVRLGSYSSIKTLVEDSNGGRPLNSLETFVVGGLCGIITVYTTMPIDTVKTRMQSVDASKHYRGMIDCLVKIATTESVSTFWRGSTARLGRLVLSGGIVFTIYENVMSLLA